MMYGTRASFAYDECTSCGSVQIARIPSPAELAEHYPQEYYAFTGSRRPRLKAWVDDQRTRHLLGRRSLVGRARARHQPDPVLPALVESGLRRDDRILDVGCGDGALLNQLARVGFSHLSGVDPFVPADTTTPAACRCRPRTSTPCGASTTS